LSLASISALTVKLDGAAVVRHSDCTAPLALFSAMVVRIV